MNLTAKQKKYIRFLSDISDTQTNKEIAQRLKVTENTLYNWRQNPEIMQKVNQTIDRNIDAELAPIYQALVRKAKQGDERVARLIFETIGRIRPQGTIDIPNASFKIEVVENKPVISPSSNNAQITSNNAKNEQKALNEPVEQEGG